MVTGRADTVPLRLLGAHLADDTLDCHVDRLRAYDWPPFLEALRLCRPPLARVRLVSRFPALVANAVDRRPLPALYSDPRLGRAFLALLADCLAASAHLTVCILDGLPLSAAMVGPAGR